MKTTTETTEKESIIDALTRFVRQRPGLEFGNYGNLPSYRTEQRSILRDLHDAEILLAKLSRSSVPVDTIKEAFSRAYAGRLSWEGGSLEYCPGQYYPTEYRKAVCAVASQALWDYYGCDVPFNIENRGDKVRAIFRRMFPRAIASRWFN
jgi:hypothetical protein